MIQGLQQAVDLLEFLESKVVVPISEGLKPAIRILLDHEGLINANNLKIEELGKEIKEKTDILEQLDIDILNQKAVHDGNITSLRQGYEEVEGELEREYQRAKDIKQAELSKIDENIGINKTELQKQLNELMGYTEKIAQAAKEYEKIQEDYKNFVQSLNQHP